MVELYDILQQMKLLMLKSQWLTGIQGGQMSTQVKGKVLRYDSINVGIWHIYYTNYGYGMSHNKSGTNAELGDL